MPRQWVGRSAGWRRKGGRRRQLKTSDAAPESTARQSHHGQVAADILIMHSLQGLATAAAPVAHMRSCASWSFAPAHLASQRILATSGLPPPATSQPTSWATYSLPCDLAPYRPSWSLSLETSVDPLFVEVAQRPNGNIQHEWSKIIVGTMHVVARDGSVDGATLVYVDRIRVEGGARGLRIEEGWFACTHPVAPIARIFAVRLAREIIHGCNDVCGTRRREAPGWRMIQQSLAVVVWSRGPLDHADGGHRIDR